MPASKRTPSFQAKLASFLALLLAAAAPAAAQNANSNKPVIAIDGALEPERIPDWMLWRELFNGVLLLADKAPDSGRNFWQTKFGFTEVQVARLIAHARAFRNAEKTSEDEIKNLALKQKNERGSEKSQMNHVKADKESRTLQFRDALKADIGTHAYEKLNSYIRINLARNIKVVQTEDRR